MLHEEKRSPRASLRERPPSLPPAAAHERMSVQAARVLIEQQSTRLRSQPTSPPSNCLHCELIVPWAAELCRTIQSVRKAARADHGQRMGSGCRRGRQGAPAQRASDSRALPAVGGAASWRGWQPTAPQSPGRQRSVPTTSPSRQHALDPGHMSCFTAQDCTQVMPSSCSKRRAPRTANGRWRIVLERQQRVTATSVHQAGRCLTNVSESQSPKMTPSLLCVERFCVSSASFVMIDLRIPTCSTSLRCTGW